MLVFTLRLYARPEAKGSVLWLGAGVNEVKINRLYRVLIQNVEPHTWR